MIREILKKFVPPTLNHLSRIYFELSKLGALASGERKPWPYGPVIDTESIFAIALQMSRYDPRLFDILVEFFYLNWKQWNPYRLRMIFSTIETPQVGCVIAEFILAKTENLECHYFFKYLTKGFQPVAPQLFFKSLYQPASKNMQRAAFEPIEEFSVWGFLANERPVIHEEPRILLGHWGCKTRQNIIYRLASEKKKFSISDYLEKVDHSISRQQALADLKDSPHICARGKGRGSLWQQKMN